ncbi:hypothetical protein F4776DRAFT_649463 [Hypoxylon sp. NC0597]|nr:hypothetical protein F4776DRAFT_649463 [Hypoxylon sp. NC0597]
MKIKPSIVRSAPENRGALEDASNRANQSPAKVTEKKTSRTAELPNSAGNRIFESFEEYVKFTLGVSKMPPRFKKYLDGAQENAGQSRVKNIAASRASSSKKRKAETPLEDEVAAYKQNLDEAISPDTFKDEPMPSCQVVRDRIHNLLDAGIMTKTEFSGAIGSSVTSLNSFLGQTGANGGSGSSVYYKAWAWFRQREVAKLEMPDVKKRQTQGPRDTSTSTGGSTSRTTRDRALPDISNIYLNGEDTDSVPVFDTCDEIRKKINAHLRTSGVTQAQFCRDLYSQLHVPKVKSIQSAQLSSFLQGKGPRTGAKSTVFYAAYVYFEKLRIAQGKPKSKHREEMEKIWWCKGGFDRTCDHRNKYFTTSGNKHLSFDRYGRTITF